MNRRNSLMSLALIALVASGLACNAPSPTPTDPQAPPPTVTPDISPTSPPQETPTLSPAETPAEATPATETPKATETATTEASPTATLHPSTETPTPSPSEGPLDFDPPTWVHSWEPLSDDQYKVVVIVNIRGGAPPFTIEHDGAVTKDSPTQERDYNLVILTSGCGAIVHNITVKSADGQEVSKDYYIGMDPQPWCED